MTLTIITEGLLKLLEANHYNPATIRFYQREWNKISSFLYAEYSDEEYSEEEMDYESDGAEESAVENKTEE